MNNHNHLVGDTMQCGGAETIFQVQQLSLPASSDVLKKMGHLDKDFVLKLKFDGEWVKRDIGDALSSEGRKVRLRWELIHE